jgi:hypothetical protein
MVIAGVRVTRDGITAGGTYELTAGKSAIIVYAARSVLQ